MSKNNLKTRIQKLLRAREANEKPEPTSQIPEEWVNPQEHELEVEEVKSVASESIFVFPKAKKPNIYQIPYKFKRVLAVTILLVTLISLFGASSPSTLAFYLANLVPPLDYLLKTRRKKVLAQMFILPDIERIEVD